MIEDNKPISYETEESCFSFYPYNETFNFSIFGYKTKENIKLDYAAYLSE